MYFTTCNVVLEMVTLQHLQCQRLLRKPEKPMTKVFFFCVAFLDFKKAYDTVSHPILISKLEYFGVRVIANNWFQSFLTNKTIYKCK